MRIRPNKSAHSTCPLCRANVVRVRGVECATCGAVAHRACVQELGGCHGTTVSDSGEFDWDQAEAETRAAERAQAARRESLERQRRELQARRDQPRPEPLSSAAKSAVLWTVGGLLVILTAAIWVKSSIDAAATFAGLATIGAFALGYTALSALRGSVQTLEEGSSEEIEFHENSVRFVVTLAGWGVLGALPMYLAWLKLVEVFGG